MWEDKPRLSSAPALFDLLLPWFPSLDFDRFVAGSIEVQDELEVERKAGMREIPSMERFRRTLARVGIDPGTDGGRLLKRVQSHHIDTLISASRIAPGALSVIAEFAHRMPVVLVSNLDDGAAGRRLVLLRGIMPYLTAVVISEEMGWRKPHRSLFERAAKEAGARCEEMLFVGDSPIDDIDGARATGMVTVWIPGAAEPPTDWKGADHTIAEIGELLDLGVIGAEGR